MTGPSGGKAVADAWGNALPLIGCVPGMLVGEGIVPSYKFSRIGGERTSGLVGNLGCNQASTLARASVNRTVAIGHLNVLHSSKTLSLAKAHTACLTSQNDIDGRRRI